VPIEKIVTLAADPSFGPVMTPAGPSWALQFLNWAGIPAVTVDGQLLPQTLILIMFAAWGVWHWILMGQNAMSAIKYHWSKRNDEQEEE